MSFYKVHRHFILAQFYQKKLDVDEHSTSHTTWGVVSTKQVKAQVMLNEAYVSIMILPERSASVQIFMPLD